MKKRISIYGTIILLTITCIFLFTSGAEAQEKYPNRPIEHIVPFPAGGQADMTARICSKYLEKYLGTPVPVVNKPGGGAVIGYTYTANSRPDGYTIMNSGAFWVPILTGTATYKVEDFTAIQFSRTQNLICVHPDAPWKNFQEFIDYARKNPGVKYAHGGVGYFGFFRMDSLNRYAKLNMTHVPFNGVADSIKAVLGKHILVAVADTGASKPHIEAGTMRPLFSFDPMALSSLDPKVQIPDFDTVFGNTIPNLENSIYISTSGKTPKEIIHILEVGIEKMTKDPQFLEESKTKLAMVPQFIPSKIVMEEKIPKNMAIAKDVMKEIGTIK